jgi:hypothetical protein
MMSSTSRLAENPEAKGGPCGTRRDAAVTIAWSVVAAAFMIVSSLITRR